MASRTVDAEESVPEDAMPAIDEQISGVDGAEENGAVQSKIG